MNSYLIVFIIIVVIIISLIIATFLYAKNKEGIAMEVSSENDYYRNTNRRCLNCAYGYKIRNKHVCVAYLNPLTHDCTATYIEKCNVNEPVNTDAQIAINILTQYFLGRGWKASDDELSESQKNTERLIAIIDKYISIENTDMDLYNTHKDTVYELLDVSNKDSETVS